MYTPTTSSESESEPLSAKDSRTNPAGLLRDDSRQIQKASDKRLIRLAEELVGKRGNILGGSSSEDLAVPLDKTYNSPVDKVSFLHLYIIDEFYDNWIKLTFLFDYCKSCKNLF